jgi:hypothetical protein
MCEISLVIVVENLYCFFVIPSAVSPGISCDAMISLKTFLVSLHCLPVVTKRLIMCEIYPVIPDNNLSCTNIVIMQCVSG